MTQQKRLSRSLIAWLPLAVAITVVCGLTYATGQQVLRQSIDDTPRQMAEDAVIALKAGASPQSIVSTKQVDLSQSAAPYLVIFDDTGKPVASSAILNGQIPVPPSGTFNAARSVTRDRFTWQPQSNVRSAATLIHYNNASSGFVLAGQSLKATEEHESDLLWITIAGWVAAMVTSFVAQFFVEQHR